MFLSIAMALMMTATTFDEPAAYATAKDHAERDGGSLLVLIGAPWCVPCKEIDRLIPHLKTRGHFVHLNADAQPHLCAAIADNGGVPRLAVFRQTADKLWVRKLYVGSDEIKDYVFPPAMIGALEQVKP